MKYEIEIDDEAVLIEVKQYNKNGKEIVIQTIIIRADLVETNEN